MVTEKGSRYFKHVILLAYIQYTSLVPGTTVKGAPPRPPLTGGWEINGAHISKTNILAVNKFSVAKSGSHRFYFYSNYIKTILSRHYAVGGF